MSNYLEMMALAKYLLIVGPIIGAMCALLSVYLVLRRMALISEGISHAGFGGIGIAVLIGYFFPVLEAGSSGPVWREIITGFFCLITAVLIGYISRTKRVSEDSAIGIFLAASVALGDLLLAVRRYLPENGSGKMPVSVENLLFGQFASVGPADAIVVSVTMVLVFATVGMFYFQFLYTTLDEEMARINGVNTKLVNTLLLLMISVVIVVCVRLVGFLMITAMTIIPGATANMLSRRFGYVLILSVLIGAIGTFAAVCLTLIDPITNYPPGPIIVLTLFTVFLVVWGYRHLFKPKVADVEREIPNPHDHAHEHPGSFGHMHSH